MYVLFLCKNFCAKLVQIYRIIW